jgi:hypothetical protein
MTIETSIAVVGVLAILAVGMLGALVLQRSRNRNRAGTAPKG